MSALGEPGIYTTPFYCVKGVERPAINSVGKVRNTAPHAHGVSMYAGVFETQL